MAMINTSVFCEQSRRTVLPWTIMQLSEESHTFNDFFEIIKPRLVSRNCKLVSAYIGPEKYSLDPVDINLEIVAVVSSFGRFLKYCVETYSDDPVVSENEGHVPGPSGTDDQQHLGFVAPVIIHNRKDKLYNDLIELFVSNNALLKEEEVNIEGKLLIKTLRDVLWYIDGYHSILAARAIAIPNLFQCFAKYNMPEMSKHRKRRTAHISSDQLNSFVQDLCVILHHGYWDRPNFREMKPSVTQLCESLARYVEYLSLKNKRAKIYHRSPTPVRELGENLRIKFVPASDIEIDSSLQSINDLLLEKPVYEYFSLVNHIPSDPVKRHRFMQSFESSGLSFSSILLVYQPGGNIGNLHFLWKVPNSGEFTEFLEHSQPVIEAVKKKIPIYHTRAMKTAMFEKFGRISPQVKPAVLRYFYRDLTGKRTLFQIIVFILKFYYSGDHSAADSKQQALVDNRIRQIIDMEDVSIVADLRSHNHGQTSKYDNFWAECDKFLSEDVGEAVDDRRHGSITHMARAISVRDLKEQVRN